MSLAMWKLEKDLCRCCHAEGSFKHLSDPCFQLGQEEIYSDMLQDCLDIKIVPMTGALSAVTYTICDSCVGRLRDAANFKRQVQDCEERFKDMYSRNLIKGFEVKEEPAFDDTDDMKQEFRSIEHNDDDEDDCDDGFMKFNDDADDSLDGRNLITIEVKAKGKGKAKPKEKAKKPTPAKKAPAKLKAKPVKMETEELTEAAVSGEKKKGKQRGGVQPNKEYAKFCKVTINMEGKKIYACTLCIRRYSIRKRWTEHYKNFHLKLKKKTHPCVICKEQLLPRLRWRHMEENHGWPAPTCKDCGRKFSYPFQVVKHHKEVHLGQKELTYVCDQCGKKFSQKFLLNQHRVMHIDERNFKCDLCAKSFKLSSTLRKHLKTHSNEKSHICEQCGKAFLNANNLKQHASKHIVEKNFKCEICSKGYKTAKLLRLHMRIHLNDRKHVCSICDAAYVQSNNLKYHIKTKHPETISILRP